VRRCIWLTHGGRVRVACGAPGSYLDVAPTEALRAYPKPVLHLGGDLDGLAQVTRLAEEYRVPQELLRAGDARAAVLSKPVVLFAGMNHAQMGNGYVTDAIRADDFVPELTQAEADALLADHTAAFLDAHRSQADEAVRNAYARLQAGLEATEPLVRFFLSAQEADAAGAWCLNGQRLVANLRADVADRLVVALESYTDVDLFVESKPSLSVSGGVADVITTAYLAPDATAAPQAVSGAYGYELDCKCKSQEAIANALGLPSDAYGVAGTCREVGAYVYQLARGAVAPHAAARHAAQGRPLVFLPDVVQGTGSDWVPSHVNYTETPFSLEVTASSLQSRDGVPVYGGMTYCKSIPAARAVAWILHDSLPRGLGRS
jgi:hypothetical protein